MYNSANVYTGLWIDYTENGSYSRLTVSNYTSGILISALTLWVTITASCCWSLVRYMMHQSGDHSASRDAFVREHEVILRCNSSNFGTITDLVCLIWKWRKRVSKTSIYHVLSIISLAILLLAATTVAGLMVSKTIIGNISLARSPTCGVWGFEINRNYSTGVYNGVDYDLQNFLNHTSQAAQYVEQCYTQANNVPTCFTARQQIEFQRLHNVSCPFDNDICLEGKQAAFAMDTGIVPNDHFGINSKDKIGFRRRTTCSPLNIDSYMEDSSDHKYQFAYYGVEFYDPHLTTSGFQRQPALDNAAKNFTKYTYYYNLLSKNVSTSYDLWTTSEMRSWEPIEALERDDGITSIFFLNQNKVHYTNPQSDPFFSATLNSGQSTVEQLQQGNGPVTNTTLYQYIATNTTTAIACLDQYQLCNLKYKDRCSPLTDYGTTFDPTYWGNDTWNNAHYKWTTEQYATILAIQIGIFQDWGDFAWPVFMDGPRALTANNLVTLSGVASPLDREQWKTEVSGWFAKGLAGMQLRIVEAGTGPAYTEIPGFEKFDLDETNNGAGTYICNHIKFRNVAGYVTYSFTDIIAIFSVGIVIIILSYSIEPLVARFLWSRGHWRYRILAWRLDNYLQLFRLANEPVGAGTWVKGLVSYIPVAEKDDGMALPIIEDGRPILNHQKVQPLHASNDMGGMSVLDSVQTLEDLDKRIVFRNERFDSENETANATSSPTSPEQK